MSHINNELKPLVTDIQNALLVVNACLEAILICTDKNAPPSERFESIKELAISALKKLPVSNNDIVTRYS